MTKGTPYSLLLWGPGKGLGLFALTTSTFNVYFFKGYQAHQRGRIHNIFQRLTTVSTMIFPLTWNFNEQFPKGCALSKNLQSEK